MNGRSSTVAPTVGKFKSKGRSSTVAPASRKIRRITKFETILNVEREILVEEPAFRPAVGASGRGL